MNFVKASLKYKQVTLTVLFLVFAVGIYSLLTMPRREDPKLTVPIGLVTVYYPGATAAQVEEQVTKKLEQYLFQYEEVLKAKTYSTTRDGVVIVNVWLNDDVKKPDIFWSKLRHQLLISKALDLPQGVKGPFVNSDFGDTEAMLIAIESNESSYAQMRIYAQMLQDNLRTISATSKIKCIGEQKEQITVYFNSDKLSQYGISLSQVIKVLQSQNTVSPTGELNTENSKVTLYTSGHYNTENEIENQIVGTSKSGSVVRLSDIANLKREYAEPTSNITVNSHKTLIVAVQMKEGNNIVWFGKDVKKKLDEVAKQLPNNVKLTTIVNQPKMVDENVSHFLREFLIAIISVIIVIALLLPFRIAAVAATAIPMTISVTFAMLHIFGIELHQVSLVALIVVLGMVVDDAIVVADNYVELLDKGVERWTAAWRSAFDLIIPILTATVTIIASFMPMIILTGPIGEFIHDLPITVTIALASSFVVAMVLTPLLCFFFIKKGLNDHQAESTTKRKTSLLDIMQSAYDKAIEWGVRNPKTLIGGSLLTIVLALILFKTEVRQRFMPYAERNQFVVELWMPTGTKLDKTHEAILRIENLVKNDKRVVSYATFSGTSAPRVYYNFAAEVPVTNYAQMLINTTSDETTEILADELSKKIEDIVPEGLAQVRLMQQGQHLDAPVEVRIYGDDINQLKKIGNDVKTIIKHTKGNHFVNDDFKEDFYGVDIQLKEGANRLGFSTSSVSQLIYIGFKGYPVTTMYEGDNPVDIVLRMNDKDRQSFQNLEDVYVQSPITGANIPLRQIADIKPKWQNGRIMHRNGMRCLTVRSETTDGVLPAELLKVIQPKIAKLQLPMGYQIEYGGEYFNKNELSGRMMVALMISLVLIFLVLLFQFRNLKETGIVMLTIPLSLFGAIFGLVITNNTFGFTSILGLISLSGIVVRNAIILIDHTNELLGKGMDIRTAAIEAGKRRLRPIFLTAMAAAIGVLPMIISGSSLWSPLASVLAFGVTWSMIMALLTVPVLYILWMTPKDKGPNHKGEYAHTKTYDSKIGISTLLFIGICLSASTLKAQEIPQKLNLQKVYDMAIQNNHFLKIKQLQVEEKQQKVNEDRVKYFPVVSVGGNYQYNSNLPELTIDQGSFGALPMGGTKIALPSTDKTFLMGENNTYNASATFYQPIAQLPKIKAGVQVSKTDLAITQAEQAKATMQIKQAAEKLYFGLLIFQKQKEEAELKLAVAKSKLFDIEGTVLAGKTTISSEIGLKANVADEEQNLLKINIQLDDYTSDLKHLIGMPESNQIVLDSISVDDFQGKILPLDAIANQAQAENSDLKMATLTKTKTEYAIKASKYNYIPDFGIVGGYVYQKGNSLYPENNTFIGASFKWNIQDMFSNTYIKKQRIYLKEQAEENIINTKEQVNVDVDKAYRRLSQSAELILVAKKVVDYRREDFKIQADKRSSGLSVESDYLTAKAVLAKAKSDLFSAQLNYRIAYTDLQILTGKY